MFEILNVFGKIVMLKINICRSDEIGRRARLKILCGQPRAGSSPAFGIFI